MYFICSPPPFDLFKLNVIINKTTLSFVQYGVSGDILTSCDWSAVIHRPAEDSEPEDLPSTVDMDAIKVSEAFDYLVTFHHLLSHYLFSFFKLSSVGSSN